MGSELYSGIDMTVDEAIVIVGLVCGKQQLLSATLLVAVKEKAFHSADVLVTLLDRLVKESGEGETASKVIAKHIFRNEDSAALFYQKGSPASSFVDYLARDSGLKDRVIADVKALRGELSSGADFDVNKFTEELGIAIKKSAVGCTRSSSPLAKRTAKA